MARKKRAQIQAQAVVSSPAQDPEPTARSIRERRAATEAEVERARSLTDRINSGRLFGLSDSAIAHRLKLPTAAVESVPVRPPELHRESGPAEEPPPAPPAAPPADPNPQAWERPMQPPPPWPHSVPPGEWMGYVQRQTPPAPEPGPMAAPSPFNEPYAVGDVYAVLAAICKEHGIDAPKTAGIVRRFSHGHPADYAKLDGILRDYGVRDGYRRSIVDAYKGETRSPDGSDEPALAALGIGGGTFDTTNPLAGIELDGDKAWAREMRKRAVEANVIGLERRARGLDQPGGAGSTGESETVKLLKEQIAQRDRELQGREKELSEARHKAELDSIRGDLTRQIDEVKRSTAAPTAAETQAKAQADLTRTITGEIAKRADDVGTLAKTARERLVQNPRLLAKIEHAIENAVDEVDPSSVLKPGDRIVDPPFEELERLANELEAHNAAPTAPRARSPEQPRFRVPQRPAEAPPPAPAPSPAQAPPAADYQSG